MMSPSLLLFIAGSLTVSLAARIVCPPPFVYLGGRWCIFVNIALIPNDQGDAVTWPEARASCQGKGGDLIILDDEKLQFVSQYIDNHFPRETIRGWVYWVGAEKTGSQWRWVNGNSVNLESDIWLPNEPSVTSPPPEYARLVQPERTHWRRYLVSAEANSISPGFICEIILERQ